MTDKTLKEIQKLILDTKTEVENKLNKLQSEIPNDITLNIEVIGLHTEFGDTFYRLKVKSSF